MKRGLFIAVLSLASLFSVRAQVREAWIIMPDSVCPYLTQQQRMSLLRYAEAGVFDTVRNALDGQSWVDSISASQLTLHLTPNLTWQLQATESGVQVIATLCAPLCAETVTSYDRLWTFLRREHTAPDLNPATDDL